MLPPLFARKELRCLRRKDLVQALARSLPAGTIRFSCHIAAIGADADSSNRTILRTVDGSTIKANVRIPTQLSQVPSSETLRLTRSFDLHPRVHQVLIGCDGANSVVAKYLGLGSPSHLPLLIMLGLTSYPHGHPFGTQFLRFAGNGFAVGRLPVTENLVHFFVSRPSTSAGITSESAAREYVLEKLQDCPDEIADMVRRCDAAETKTLTKVWYRSPWQVLLGRFQRSTVTVAGDAMHVMGPYIGQGGSAALEDAVVLARTLSRSVPDGVVVVDGSGSTRSRELQEKISVALGEYVRERRARLFMLSLESYVIGNLRIAKSLLKKLACVAMRLFWAASHVATRHANYDCGPL